MATPKQKKEINMIDCVTCGRHLSADRNYYQSFDKSDDSKYNNKLFFGKIPYCRSCIKERFIKFYKDTKDIKMSIIAICAEYSFPFEVRNIPAYDIREIKGLDGALEVFGGFMKTNGSIGKKILTTNYFDIQPFLTSAFKDNLDEDKMFFNDEIDLEIDSEVVRFFGGGFTEREYKLLLLEYLELVRNFGADDYDKITLFKDISFLNVSIADLKSKGSAIDEITKLMEKRNKIMVGAGLTGEKTDTKNSQYYIGNMIKKMENQRPAAEDEWNQNQMEELATIIAGHLMKVEGKDGDIREAYEKIMEKYTVNAIENVLDEGDFDDEE